MKPGQEISRGRCDECKRRKKRCVGTGSICDFCQKKGLQCTNHNTVKIFHFETPRNTKRQKTVSSSQQGNEEALFQVEQCNPAPHTSNPSIREIQNQIPVIDPQLQSTANSQAHLQKHPSHDKITPSSLVEMIKANLPHNPETMSQKQGLEFDKAPKLYLPSQKIELSKSQTQSPILHDEITIKVFSQETVIPKEFSLLDFLLSSTRVNFVDLSTCHLEEPVSFDEIEKFLKVSRSKRTMDTLKEKGYLVSSKMSNLRGAPLSPISPDNSSSSENSMQVNYKSLNDVDFKIDLENLKTHFYIQKAAVHDDVANENQKFANLPDSIDPEFADNLFQRFCAYSQESSTFQDLDLSSLPSYEEAFETSRDYVKINYLKVCFPLIFGNVTVLKCVLIISYYKWKNTEPNNTKLCQMEDSIKELHLDVLEELQERLSNCFSICCDHSLLCILLLLSTEVVTGLRGPLWKKLLKLIRDMIVLRGGVPKLLETLTGLCLMKLLSIHLSVGGLFSFQTTEITNSAHSLSLADFFNVLDSHHQLDFFDNSNYYSKLGLNDIKGVVRTYGHITQLYNLSVISYDANNQNGDSTLKLYGDYDSVSLTNLELVLNDAETLEKEIQKSFKHPEINQSNLPYYHKLQVSFAQKTALLYLYQVVYRQNSLSPKTVLAIQILVKEVGLLFDELQNLSFEDCQRSPIFIMPLFLVGVDLISENKRSWYKKELLVLYDATKKASLMTCISLLEEVWRLNVDGSLHIDWRALAESYEMDVCLCA